MTFEVEVAGRAFTVGVDRADRPGRFRITIGGVARVIDVSRAGEFGLSLLDGGTADLQIVPGAGPDDLLVSLHGRTVDVTVNGRRTAHAEGALRGHGLVTIVAPMPGRVVRVLVAPGDEVGARQPVVVVEAMKMENELRAPRAGHVKEIVVAPGTPVEAGRVLAVIE